MNLGAFSRLHVENQQRDKHVESIFVTCLDAGSTPADSTKFTQPQSKFAAFFISAFRDFCKSKTKKLTLFCKEKTGKFPLGEEGAGRLFFSGFREKNTAL